MTEKNTRAYLKMCNLLEKKIYIIVGWPEFFPAYVNVKFEGGNS
jgi:hypothetical protein